MTDEIPPYAQGAEEHPIFAPLPEIVRYHTKPKVFVYKALLDVVREHPNSPARIAVFEKGSPESTKKLALYAATRINQWIAKQCPLELWQIAQRRIPDTWCRREIWATFLGTFTAEDMAKLKDQRKDWFRKGRRANDLQKREREAIARMLSEYQRKQAKQ